jgi:WD40 repeat protein
MDFIANWREQINSSLAESARLAARVRRVDLEYALMAVGVLWPLRQPAQDFEIPAIEAAHKILGRQAKYILRVAQTLDNDFMEAAQGLNVQLAHSSELEAALNTLIKYFNAFFVFTDKLSNYQVQQSETTLPGNVDADLMVAMPLSTLEQQVVSNVFKVSNQPPRVFISYARKDGEDLARQTRERLEQQGIPVWQDRVKMEGGRDWWLQITGALNQVEFMVLIMTPGAIASEIVGKEWRYARQQGVCVYPIIGSPDLNFAELPRWMRNVHFYNPSLEWSKLINDLNQPCEMPRVPFMVEDLSDDFVSRSAELNQLISALLDENGDPIAATIGLYGTGGYGKTVLAKALCHHDGIRHAFDDGVLWVTLGENPGDLTGRVVDLVEVLSGERPGFAGLEAAETRLVQLLADRDILMVIDDVWNVAHLKPFMRGGVRCARLITTRNVAALPPKTYSLEVGALDRDEAINLLRVGLPDAPLKPLQDLAERLGWWPLLLKLTNATLRDRVYNNNQALYDAFAYVNKALDKRGLTAFDAHNAAARDQAVSQTLSVSQDLLTEDERKRYGELALFPGDIRIPLDALTKLWGATAGLDDFDTEELCERLHRLSLLAYFDPNSRYISLHNIVRRYLAQEQQDNLASLHNLFLNAYIAYYNLAAPHSGTPGWANLPHQEAYLWTHLAYHLAGADRGAELAITVKDLTYLVTKTYLRKAYAAESDLLVARRACPDDPILTRLHQGLSQASHLLDQCDTLSTTANTLHSRLAHIPGLSELAEATEIGLPKPLLTAARRLPDLPDSSLIRTLTGHGVALTACAMSADGATIVSMARDATLKIWDADTGAERFTLSGHKVVGNCCAISADGAVVASATWDGVLKIWDASTGSEIISIQAHNASIYGCALSLDGAMVVTASKDRTVKIWDAYTGKARLVLEGHERAVTGCDITGNGASVVSTSPDGTVRLWDVHTGKPRFILRAYEAMDMDNLAADLTFTAEASALLSCAISADGSTLVSTLPNGTLKVWEADAGMERFVLEGHSGWVQSCAISADGQLIVSAANDKTIKGWDTRSGALCFSLEGHTRPVTGCALNAKGALIASVSQDKTLKLWDAQSGAEQITPSGFDYKTPTQYCAISADGRRIVLDSKGNSLKVIDSQTDTEYFELKGHIRPVTGCALSLDGSLIVSSSQDRTLKIWDARRGTERFSLSKHLWAVNGCALSRDGRIIVSASDDSTLKVWDALSGTERFSLAGHMRGVNGCAISPDHSFIASASADKTVKLWDTRTGVERVTLTGHAGPVNSCDISPDSSLVASASNDATIKVWAAQTGREIFTLEGHTSSVLRAIFSPDGALILSISKGRTVKLWAVDTGRCYATLRIDGALSDCAWFPDGQHILVVGGPGAYFLKLIR